MSASGSIGSNSTSRVQPSYGNNRLSNNESIKGNFNTLIFSPVPELKSSLNNLFQQGINQIDFNGVRGKEGHQDRQGSEGIQLAKGPATNTRIGSGVGTTTSYTQPFINNNISNLTREIQIVRPTFRYNRVTQIGAPYNQNDVNTLTGIRDKLRAELLAQLPQSDTNSIVVQNMTLASLNDRVDQTLFRTYQANGGKANFQEWLTEKPTSSNKSMLVSDLPNKSISYTTNINKNNSGSLNIEIYGQPNNGAEVVFKGTFDEDRHALHIDWYANPNQGTGYGGEIISEAIGNLDRQNVKVVTGQLGDTNLERYEDAIGFGQSPEQAAWSTPLGKSMQSLGFTEVTVIEDLDFVKFE